MNPGSVLEVQDVTVRFGGLTALDAVSLFVPPRHVLGIIGPNGAGKTTLLNVLCGFIRPDAGEVLFGGRRPDIRPHRLASPRSRPTPILRATTWVSPAPTWVLSRMASLCSRGRS
jgi:ABC-type branched-subunit amino acid transport system ATPase component